MVQGIQVNKALLSIWLERLTHRDWSEMTIHALLNPKDPQNVPRAVELLTCIADLRNIDPGDNPSDQRVHQALCLIGEAIEALLRPFLDVTMALSPQFTSLVKAGHILFALYRQNKSHFISNQLFGDIQCLVKRAAFDIGQTQELDGELAVSFNIFGTDGIETLFGRCRMAGQHSPNMDIAECEMRIRAAMTMADIFAAHPTWERRPDRLKFSRSRDYDHVSPHHWEADLKDCVNKGRRFLVLSDTTTAV